MPLMVPVGLGKQLGETSSSVKTRNGKIKLLKFPKLPIAFENILRTGRKPETPRLVESVFKRDKRCVFNP